MRKTTLFILGMSCNHCVLTILGVLENMGIAANVDLSTNTATIEYDENQFRLEQIVKAIEEKGYGVMLGSKEQ